MMLNSNLNLLSEMITTNYLGSETQFVCDLCSETVKNPICTACLTFEIEAWLTLYPDLREYVIPRLVKFVRRMEDRIPVEGVECIKCKMKRAFICPSCFAEHTLIELKKMHANRIVLKEFSQFFHFDKRGLEEHRVI